MFYLNNYGNALKHCHVTLIEWLFLNWTFYIEIERAAWCRMLCKDVFISSMPIEDVKSLDVGGQKHTWGKNIVVQILKVGQTWNPLIKQIIYLSSLHRYLGRIFNQQLCHFQSPLRNRNGLEFYFFNRDSWSWRWGQSKKHSWSTHVELTRCYTAKNGTSCLSCVTRLGDLLDFGQIFKTFGSN